MKQKTVFQLDRAGHYMGATQADESPQEPGVFLMPSGTIEVEPPATWPKHQWPRWNGFKWELVTKPAAAAPMDDPVAKLQSFLANNPDVAALLQNNEGASLGGV